MVESKRAARGWARRRARGRGAAQGAGGRRLARDLVARDGVVDRARVLPGLPEVLREGPERDYGPNFRALIGIFSQIVGPSLAILPTLYNFRAAVGRERAPFLATFSRWWIRNCKTYHALAC